MGIISRDSVGNFLGARCLTQKIITDPHTAEAMATSWAVSFSKDVGFFNVVFEGDALRVIREANSEPPLFSRSGHFIEGVQQKLKDLDPLVLLMYLESITQQPMS